MNQKDQLEKWIKQIKAGQINPEALGLDSNPDKAIAKLKSQITKISSSYKTKL